MRKPVTPLDLGPIKWRNENILTAFDFHVDCRNDINDLVVEVERSRAEKQRFLNRVFELELDYNTMETVVMDKFLEILREFED